MVEESSKVGGESSEAGEGGDHGIHHRTQCKSLAEGRALGANGCSQLVVVAGLSTSSCFFLFSAAADHYHNVVYCSSQLQKIWTIKDYS